MLNLEHLVVQINYIYQYYDYFITPRLKQPTLFTTKVNIS